MSPKSLSSLKDSCKESPPGVHLERILAAMSPDGTTMRFVKKMCLCFTIKLRLLSHLQGVVSNLIATNVVQYIVLNVMYIGSVIDLAAFNTMQHLVIYIMYMSLERSRKEQDFVKSQKMPCAGVCSNPPYCWLDLKSGVPSLPLSGKGRLCCYPH